MRVAVVAVEGDLDGEAQRMHRDKAPLVHCRVPTPLPHTNEHRVAAEMKVVVLARKPR